MTRCDFDDGRQAGPDLRLRLAQFGLLTSCLPLIGWLGGIGWLVRLDSAHAAIVATTALCFLLLFLALARLASGARDRMQGALLLAVVVLVVAETFGAGLHALPWAMGLAGQAPVAGDAMSAATGLGLLLACLTLWLLSRNADSTLGLCAAIFGLSTSATILLGHSFDPGSIYALPLFSEMSLYTAALFALFFASLFAPDHAPNLSSPA